MATEMSGSNDHWFYVQSGIQSGPIGTSALRTMSATGQIKATDLVWRQGMSDWALAARVKGLFPESVAALTPPPLPSHAYIRPSAKPSATSASANMDEQYNSLYCSSDEKRVLGLCGGLAHKFGLPIGAVRFAALVSMFAFIGFFYFAGLFLPKLPTKGVPRPA